MSVGVRNGHPWHSIDPVNGGRKWSSCSAMKGNLTTVVCEVFLAAAWVIGGAATGHAQSAPELREILNRLDRLENENRALTDEVRALRQELAGGRGVTPALKPYATVFSSSALATDGQSAAAGQPSAAEPSTNERLALQQNRIDELAQTKVEASEKFPLRITGMALFNGYVNGRNNNNTENPTIASQIPADATGGGTLRQTTLGLLFHGPLTFLGGKVSGSLYMDFFGGSTSSLNHLFRLRTAAIDVDWKNTSFMVGQDKPLISQRDPNSLAQVGVSPLTGAGNLWLWQPQIRLEQRLALGNDSGLRLQAAAIQTSQLNATVDPNAYVTSPTGLPAEESNPAGEGRVEVWRRWSESGRLEIAGGLHVNRNHAGRFDLPTNIYSLDWFFRPTGKVEFSGMFYHGRNVAVLGALRQGFTILNGRWLSVPSNGGWAQLRFPITERLSFDIYGGQQDDKNSDLVVGNIGKNQAYFGNVMYRFAPNVMVSLEGGQVRTTYLGSGNRLNDHYDLAIGYLF